VIDRRRSPLNLKVLLDAVEAAPPVAAAEVVGAALRDALGARDVAFLIADYSGRSLIRLGHGERGGTGAASRREQADTVPLIGTPHGRALADQRVQVLTDDAGSRVVAPVTSRGEAVGVLELALDAAPDERTIAAIALAAHALAYVVIANRRFTDLYEWGQRSLPLSLEAEIQHRLLPSSYTLEGGQFTLAGWLEPAGDVGGDTFDFSVERDTLHLSMTDAMGHTLSAALLATVLVGALRNARRRGVGLGRSGAAGRRGPHAPCRRRGVRHGPARPGRPALGRGPRGQRRPPGADPDPRRARRAGAAGGRPAVRGVDVPDLPGPGAPARGGRPARVHHRRHARAQRRGGRRRVGPGRQPAPASPRGRAGADPRGGRACGGELRDDATVLCLDWHGGPPRLREATAGADR
jgi:hypothetical protein